MFVARSRRRGITARLVASVPAIAAGVAALSLVAVAPARANSVVPSCIPTLATPVNIAVDPYSVVVPRFGVVFGFGTPVNGYLGSLSDLVQTRTGFRATVVFNEFLIGDPTVTAGTGAVSIVELYGSGLVVGPLQVGNCPPKLTRKQARRACRNERRTIGVPAFKQKYRNPGRHPRRNCITQKMQ